jgi:hypothetical protein
LTTAAKQIDSSGEVFGDQLTRKCCADPLNPHD